MSHITIRFTRSKALSLGLIVCECGHPPNNHFGFDDKPCAHCGCKKYRETVRWGTLLKQPPSIETRPPDLYEAHINTHVFKAATYEQIAFTNCDRCGEQYGARYVRTCPGPVPEAGTAPCPRCGGDGVQLSELAFSGECRCGTCLGSGRVPTDGSASPWVNARLAEIDARQR
jgi:hypothetical protein